MKRPVATLAAALVIAGGLVVAVLAGAGIGFSASAAEYGTAPDCSNVKATPSTLNANGKFTRVTLSGATDADGDELTYAITGVTQDEPVDGPPGTTGPDAIRTNDPASVLLRGERDPRGDGRVYTIAYTVSDVDGTCSGTTTVEVRRKNNVPAVAGSQSYNSFG